MKKYLVQGADNFDIASFRFVMAATAEEALEKYMREVESRDNVFREHVIDLAVNMTFVEQFHLSSNQEQARFDQENTVGTEDLILKSRVRQFFSDEPAIGERFIKYMETEDQRYLDDAVFAFIATHDVGWKNGFQALDIGLVKTVV